MLLGAAAAAALIAPLPARAGDDAAATPAPAADDADSIAAVLGPFGDLGGLRPALKAKGITFDISYTGEVLGNVSGGFKRGALYQGLLKLDIDADLGTLMGWSGATFHASGFQISGRSLTAYDVGSLMPVSSIEAPASTRLDELWLQQSLLGGKVALRAGMLAADSTFLASTYGPTFLNGTFGYPAIIAADLPNGGPAYPYATPGVLLTLSPTDNLSFMAEVQDGDPLGRHTNPNGTNFRIDDPAFVIAEAKYSYKLGAAALPGAVHVGGWYDGDSFADQRFTAAGLSIANPAGTGVPARHRGDQGVYAMIDQMLYKVPGTEDRGLGMFLRGAVGPSDRNLIDAYVDGGLTYKGLIPGRPDDVFGVGAAYAHISDRAAAFDQDVVAFTGTPMPIRDYEGLIEVTYQAKIIPGLTLQPDFQYIFHPGGHVPGPTGAAVKNAAVFGLRVAVT
jgi:porin